MIGVFINPGRRPDQPEPTQQEWGDRTTNRPTEYNSLDDKYARVVVDELLPALNKDYNISKDPERRGIGGASSGAIAGFTVAWERPAEFHKVLSIVGSFTHYVRDQHGGDEYPDIVRQNEKKPIRIFLQDGRNDNRNEKLTRAGLVFPECSFDASAHRKRLRRELRLGHEQARPEDGRRDPARYDALALARPRGFNRFERRRRAVIQLRPRTIGLRPVDLDHRH